MNTRRIQRRRTKGWKMPLNTVYVGRPSKWGNPFKTGDGETPNPEAAARRFARMLQTFQPELSADHRLFAFTTERIRADLRGKNLACWCPLDQPCHADLLLEIANS